MDNRLRNSLVPVFGFANVDDIGLRRRIDAKYIDFDRSSDQLERFRALGCEAQLVQNPCDRVLEVGPSYRGGIYEHGRWTKSRRWSDLLTPALYSRRGRYCQMAKSGVTVEKLLPAKIAKIKLR